MPRMRNDDFKGYKKIQVGLYLRAGLSKSETAGSWLVLLSVYLMEKETLIRCTMQTCPAGSPA